MSSFQQMGANGLQNIIDQQRAAFSTYAPKLSFEKTIIAITVIGIPSIFLIYKLARRKKKEK